MKKNKFIKVMCFIIAMAMFMPIVPHNDAFAAAKAASSYWYLTTSGNTNNKVSQKLYVETYLNGTIVTDEDANITLNYKTNNIGNIKVESNSGYLITKLELVEGSEIETITNNGKKLMFNNVYIRNGGSKTLKIYIETESTNISYNIEYYVDSTLIETEAKEVSNYTAGSPVVVDYKSAEELNLSSDYIVKGEVEKTIILDLNDTSKNIVKVFYSNAKEVTDIQWYRTSENDDDVIAISPKFYSWDWSDVKNISLEEFEDDKVWDGNSYNRYYNGYSNSNLCFEYATWKQQHDIDMRRLQAIITIPDGYDGNDFVRMKSVNQGAYSDINNGNIVPINDNIFVFVYPEDNKETISDNNYLDYLAFWSGTVSQNNKAAYYPNSSAKGIKGNNAIQISKSNDSTNYNLLKQTDGWYVEATVDNIGEKLIGSQSGDKYVIDIFTQDYAEGGGMDKFVFEFIKNKAPRVQDDVYISAKGETLNISDSDTNNGILDNDLIYVPEAGAKAELKVDEVLLKNSSTSGLYNLYDANGKLGGTISDFNEDDGTFTFKPNGDYIGVLEFNYSCYQKKAGQNDVDSNLKDEGKVNIYVLPAITVNHNQASIKDNKITDISSFLGTDTIYGWPSDKEWNESWTWPESDALVNRHESKKSSYTAISDTFQNHSYIGYMTEDGDKVPDSLNSSKTLSGTFSSDNKTVGFYYEKGKSNLIVESYIEGTSTLLKKDSFIKYKGEAYTVAIPSIEGYTYVSSDVDLSGSMPSDGGLTVKLYFEPNLYDYSVEYYFNDNMEYEAVYSKPYNTVVTNYLKAEEISALKDKVIKEGFVFGGAEFPNGASSLTINTAESENVIRVYYKSSLNEFLGFSMYSLKGANNPIEPVAKNNGYKEYSVINGFDYTFGISFIAGTANPDIDLLLSDDMLADFECGNFKLYDISDDEVKTISGISDLKELNVGNTYILTYKIKSNTNSGSNYSMLVDGSINSSDAIYEIKLKVMEMPKLD